MEPPEDIYADLVRSIAARRATLTELRELARQEADAARQASERLLQMAALATERARAILAESEARLTRRRERRAPPPTSSSP